MKRTTVLIMLFSCLSLAVAVPAFSMTADSTFEPAKPRKGADQPTGLFGGIRADGTFEFRLSESRGVRFYRLSSGVRLSGFPAGQTLQNLVVGTPIRLTIDDYRITVVELLGGQP